MGDLVLLHEEVNPVMKKLVDGGIEITALHNHLLRAEPMTLYMHIEAHGDPKFQENFAVVADASSSTGGNVTDRLVFKVVRPL